MFVLCLFALTPLANLHHCLIKVLASLPVQCSLAGLFPLTYAFLPTFSGTQVWLKQGLGTFIFIKVLHFTCEVSSALVL
jgi:hypothetical protein